MKRLRVSEAAEYTSVPEGTLRYWRSARVGPMSYKIGRTVFYDINELDDWIAEQKAASQVGGAVS